MKHINIKNKGYKKTDFKIIKDNLTRDSVSIQYKNGQFLDHDLVLREINIDYSGVWSSEEEAKKFLSKHFGLV